MGKSVHNDVLDAALNYIKNNAQTMHACSAEPTTYTQASAQDSTGYSLADIALDSGGADITVGEGDSSSAAGGRKATVGQQADVTVDVTDDATHVALVDDDNTKLLIVTTCTQQTLTQGNTVTFPAWDIGIADP